MLIDVQCDRVSKRYRVRSRQPADDKRSLGRRVLESVRPPTEDFWALRDVSFSVARGETVGIIGRNGAGKSTLLKLLGGITAPSAGEIRIVGRLSALIEVGSGFHPELTGRENVFLSGAILGMRARAIAQRLDSIADFSGVSAFLDTPVKYYSSGMYVRLGFAIAAHLEPDVLLVDEVLAVGDSEFQARCLDRIQAMKRGGTTMIVVSHDLGAVEQVSDRAVLIEGGTVAAEASPHEVISRYQRLVHGPDADGLASAAPGDGELPADVRIDTVRLLLPNGDTVITATAGGPLVARVGLVTHRPIATTVALSFYDFDNGTLLAECVADAPPQPGCERCEMEFAFPELLLAPGAYTLGATVTPRGASQPVAWRFGRTTLYVQGPGAARGLFTQPFHSRVVDARQPLAEVAPQS